MRTKHIWGSALLLLLTGTYFLLKTQTGVLDVFTRENLQVFLSGYGVWSPLVFMGIQAIAVVFSQLPNIPLTMAAGALWGSWLGFLYSLIGALLGGCIAFLLSRWLGKDFVKKLVGERYEFVEDLSEKHLVVTIFVLRLVPFLSFDVISYGAGLTTIKFRNFLLATLLGMIPMTLLFAYFGQSVMLGRWLSWLFTGAVLVAMFLLPRAWAAYRDTVS